MERSVVLVKPDGVQRGLIGEIIHRFERKGLKLVGLSNEGMGAISIRRPFGKTVFL